MDTVSEIYKNRPSAASAKANPSSDCNAKTQSTITKQRGPNLCQVRATCKNTPYISNSCHPLLVLRSTVANDHTKVNIVFWFRVKEFNIWYTQSRPGSFVSNLHFERAGEIDLQGLSSCYVFGCWRDCWRQRILEKFVVGEIVEECPELFSVQGSFPWSQKLAAVGIMTHWIQSTI